MLSKYLSFGGSLTSVDSSRSRARALYFTLQDERNQMARGVYSKGKGRESSHGGQDDNNGGGRRGNSLDLSWKIQEVQRSGVVNTDGENLGDEDVNNMDGIHATEVIRVRAQQSMCPDFKS